MLGIAVLCITAIGVTLIVSPRARVLVKGFGSLFVEDIAKTPKGANAIYLQAIEEAQRAYGQASDTLNLLAGKLADTKIEYGKTEKELRSLEHKCDALARKNDVASLNILAAKRSALLTKQETLQTQVRELQPMLDEAKFIHNTWELKLTELKSQKELKLGELELAKSMKQVYAKMDDLRRDSATGKLLDAVNDGVRKTKLEALGAHVVHQNRVDTKVAAIDRRLEAADQDVYVQQLLQKYNR